MKLKTLAVLTAVGVSASAFGQGVILQNVGTSAGGTNGAVFQQPTGQPKVKFDGINNNIGVTITGGPDASSLQPVGLGTYRVTNDPKGYTGSDVGTFQLGAAGAAVNIPGVAAGGVATIHMDLWFDGVSGLFSSYTAAANGGGLVASITFLQNTGNPPLVPPPSLNGMPDVTLVPVPEPSTLALAGLGIASLLVFRRRN